MIRRDYNSVSKVKEMLVESREITDNKVMTNPGFFVHQILKWGQVKKNLSYKKRNLNIFKTER